MPGFCLLHEDVFSECLNRCTNVSPSFTPSLLTKKAWVSVSCVLPWSHMQHCIQSELFVQGESQPMGHFGDSAGFLLTTNTNHNPTSDFVQRGTSSSPLLFV